MARLVIVVSDERPGSTIYFEEDDGFDFGFWIGEQLKRILAEARKGKSPSATVVIKVKE